MLSAVPASHLALLAAVGLIGGIGITAIGPGGVLPTIGLFGLTSLSAAQVAGTAIVTHIATGALGTAVFTRSGQLREARTRTVALTLAVTAVFGTPLGVAVGAAVNRQTFAVVLGLVVATAAGLVWYRARDLVHEVAVEPTTAVVVAVGVGVSVASGAVGIGGPMLTVPLLIVAGLPVLEALACAQVQSIVIATVGTLGYVIHSAIDWPLAALVGLPELAGVVIGWRVAHALPAVALRRVLVVVLGALSVYLIVRR